MSGSWSDWEHDRIITITHIPREAPAIATLTRQRDDLAASVERLEDEIVGLRREVARLTAEKAQEPRKAPLWLLPFAYVGWAWGGYCRSYSYEPEGDEE